MNNEHDFDEDDTPFPTPGDQVRAVAEELYDDYLAIGVFYNDLYDGAFEVDNLNEQLAWLDKYTAKLKIHRERLAIINVDLANGEGKTA